MTPPRRYRRSKPASRMSRSTGPIRMDVEPEVGAEDPQHDVAEDRCGPRPRPVDRVHDPVQPPRLRRGGAHQRMPVAVAAQHPVQRHHVGVVQLRGQLNEVAEPELRTLGITSVRRLVAGRGQVVVRQVHRGQLPRPGSDQLMTDDAHATTDVEHLGALELLRSLRADGLDELACRALSAPVPIVGEVSPHARLVEHPIEVRVAAAARSVIGHARDCAR